MLDVAGEKIWIELKAILRQRFAGHLMRTILELQLGPLIGLPSSCVERFELENRWLRCMDSQPEPMTLLVTLFDDQEEVFDGRQRRTHPSRSHRRCYLVRNILQTREMLITTSTTRTVPSQASVCHTSGGGTRC